ncbi:arsinothricin resistance N-acetyltransferase ArsN1 family A [Wukongibacter baidiensis]|uniref:arsinothricin resistance N-acetyltransferase ArsN1 family A n=1 Tax=Wukongibacter baidiensis TaxID=1723361 RepID=UPI003D7F4151
MSYSTRLATIEDIPSITTIYNQGIEDRIATLETRLRTTEDMNQWLINRSEKHKVIVITDELSTVLGWASLNAFNSRCSYSGVVDISIYIKRSMRGKGLGKILLNNLVEVAKEQGFHKLVLSTFDSNQLGQRLYASVEFRKVGTYIKQGILDNKWIDITIMEKLLL